MVNYIIKSIKKKRNLRFVFFNFWKFLFNANQLTDEKYLKKKYRYIMGRKLDLKNPKTFNEKLQWLKINDRNPMYTKMVDKYEVKNYIIKELGTEYIIPTLGIWDNFTDIDFDKLPDQFVLKCTNDSGSVVLCKDKKTFDKAKAKAIIDSGLKNNFFYDSREWPYKNVKPRIIAEQYMENNYGSELLDYKLLCFNGKVKCSFICLNRNSKNGLNVDFYDNNWEIMPFERHYPRSGITTNKPKNFNKMIEFAEKLSKNIPFVRVDFYEINGALFFGELTFFPGAGFEEFTPESFDYLLGSWINLPSKTKIEDL